MAIAVPMSLPVTIPVSPAGPMPNPWQSDYPQYYVDQQQMQQYAHYQQEVQHAYHNSLPTPVSGALPVQAGTSYDEHSRFGTSGYLDVTDDSKFHWTPERDDLLVECHEKKMKWDQIAQQCFGGKVSGNACRKRHSRVLLERQEPARWDEQKTSYMLGVYNEDLRQRMWSLYAQAAGNGVTWQECEKFAYSQGSKAMTGKPALVNRHSVHRRTKSRARSQQSRHSISSDTTQQLHLEDDEHNTSGLSNETRESFQLPPLQPQLSPHHAQHYHAHTTYSVVPTQYAQPEEYYHEYA